MKTHFIKQPIAISTSQQVLKHIQFIPTNLMKLKSKRDLNYLIEHNIESISAAGLSVRLSVILNCPNWFIQMMHIVQYRNDY